LKEIWATEVEAAKSRRAAEKAKNVRLKAERTTELAAAKAQRVGERARCTRQEPHGLGAVGVMPTETGQGGQADDSPFSNQGEANFSFSSPGPQVHPQLSSSQYFFTSPSSFL
jgi:hypothetical protein